jgi:FecR protein
MKTIQMLAGCILVLAMAGVARAETYSKPAAITIVAVSGEARYSNDGKAWHPIVVGKILRQGAVLETASGSTVDLVVSGTPVPLPETSSTPLSQTALNAAPDPNIRGYEAFKPSVEQNVVRMQPNTMLAVDQLSVVNTGADTVGNTELDLRAGNIFFNVKKLSASSQFIIKLPNGVAGIRGCTGFGGADDHFACYSGQIVIVVMGPNGQLIKVSVNGSFEYDPNTEKVVGISKSIKDALKAFGISVGTLLSQTVTVTVVNGVIYISPTEGRKPLVAPPAG